MGPSSHMVANDVSLIELNEKRNHYRTWTFFTLIWTGSCCGFFLLLNSLFEICVRFLSPPKSLKKRIFLHLFFEHWEKEETIRRNFKFCSSDSTCECSPELAASCFFLFKHFRCDVCNFIFFFLILKWKKLNLLLSFRNKKLVSLFQQNIC